MVLSGECCKCLCYPLTSSTTAEDLFSETNRSGGFLCALPFSSLSGGEQSPLFPVSHSFLGTCYTKRHCVLLILIVLSSPTFLLSQSSLSTTRMHRFYFGSSPLCLPSLFKQFHQASSYTFLWSQLFLWIFKPMLDFFHLKLWEVLHGLRINCEHLPHNQKLFLEGQTKS